MNSPSPTYTPVMRQLFDEWRRLLATAMRGAADRKRIRHEIFSKRLKACDAGARPRMVP